ncbi:Hypothetical predicted protein, partial [Paramuricea clavata]
MYDHRHGIAKFTIDIDTGLQFTTYLFNWPIPDDHTIYTTQKRCIKSFEDVNKLIRFVENSNLCKGLPQGEESKSVVTDPTWDDK